MIDSNNDPPIDIARHERGAHDRPPLRPKAPIPARVIVVGSRLDGHGLSRGPIRRGWPVVFADSPRLAAGFAWRFLCGPLKEAERTFKAIAA